MLRLRLAWALGPPVVVVATFGMLWFVFSGAQNVGQWLNQRLSTEGRTVYISTALWEVVFLGLLAGVVLIVLITVRLLRLWTSPTKPSPGGSDGNAERARWPIVALVGVLTGCLSVAATLYVLHGNRLTAAEELQAADRAERDARTLAIRENRDARFLAATNHMASSESATRAMGLAEMALLADEWLAEDPEESGRAQATSAIDAIIIYLTTPFDPTIEGANQGEIAVRSQISRILHNHLATDWPQTTAVREGPCDRGLVLAAPAPEGLAGADAQEYVSSSTVQPSHPTPPTVSCWSDFHTFDFQNAKFYSADFSWLYFKDRVSFEHADFYGWTAFQGVVFEQEASFWQAEFHPHGWSGREDRGWVNFNQAVFTGGANFYEAFFEHAGYSNPDVTFLGTRFHAGAQFVGSTFSGSVDFSSAEFSIDAGIADFREVIFASDDGCAEECTIEPDANFTQARFHGVSTFKDSAGVDPYFHHATFGGDADLDLWVEDDLPYDWCERLSGASMECWRDRDRAVTVPSGNATYAVYTPRFQKVTIAPGAIVTLTHQIRRDGTGVEMTTTTGPSLDDWAWLPCEKELVGDGSEVELACPAG